MADLREWNLNASLPCFERGTYCREREDHSLPISSGLRPHVAISGATMRCLGWHARRRDWISKICAESLFTDYLCYRQFSPSIQN